MKASKFREVRKDRLDWILNTIRSTTDLIEINETQLTVLTIKGYPKELNPVLLELATKFGYYIETKK